MVESSVFLGLLMLGGGVLAICPAPTALATVVTLLMLRRGLTWRLVVFGGVMMSVGALRAGRAVAALDAERAAVRTALGGPVRCFARAEVVSSPVLMHSAATLVPAGSSDGAPPLTAGWDADLRDVECDDRKLDIGFRARLYGGPDDLARGDQVEVIAGLAPLQLFHNGDLGDPRPSAARRGTLASGGTEDVRVVQRGRGVAGAIDRLRAHVRRRIEATFEPLAAPMARALVLGESDLDADDNRAFRSSGLAHLLAVSGTHLVLVVVSTVSALTALLRRIPSIAAGIDVGRLSASFGVVFAWAYADFAGGSGSARRAAAMLSIGLAARALGRGADGPRAFGLSLLGAALWDPLIAFDLSFLLSVTATAGLMVLQRPLVKGLATAVSEVVRCGSSFWHRSRDVIHRRVRMRLIPRRDATLAVFGARTLRDDNGGRAVPSLPLPNALVKITEAVATTLSATIGCAPLIAFLAPTLPIGGVPANLLAVPVGELLALPLCMAHVFLGVVPVAERGDALVASGSLLVVRAIAKVTERIAFLSLPVPPPSAWQCAVLFCAAVAIWYRPRSDRLVATLVGIVALVVLEARIRREGAPLRKLRVTVLDVGQGDASIVDLPDGQAFLVDAGGMVGSPVDTGQAVVDPVLRVRRRSALAAVILSHPHPDHFGGIASGVAALRVREFWDSGQGEREGAGPVYASLLRDFRARGTTVLRPDALCGRPRQFGEARVEVLAPCPGPVPFANANDNSLVIRLSYGDYAALLVGDAEHDEEETLVARSRPFLRADFLKVGHHGSRTSSSPEFLRAVGAREAAISCGVRNRFGHPHPIALGHLAEVARVWRTDRDGSVRWETDGKSAQIVTSNSEDAVSAATRSPLVR